MQVGTPTDIYRRPANTFVASFIGSPPMNLLPCEIDAAARRVRFETGDIIALPDHILEKVGNTKVIFGIRPEHITIHNQSSEHALPGDLYVTQMLGSETLIVVRVGDQLISVSVSSDDLPPVLTRVWLEFNPAHMFFYDSEGNLIA